MTTSQSTPRFSQYPEVTYFFNLRQKFIYAPIPKAGCSTIKSLIYQLCKAESDKKLPVFLPHEYSRKWFHVFMDLNFTLSTLPDESAEKVLSDPTMFRFAFVRNPLSRLASAFLNKFVRDRFDQEQWEHTEPTLRRIYGPKARALSHTISFAQLVEDVCRTEDLKLDPHWRPMHTFLNPDRGFRIGRVETMAEDWPEIASRTKLPADLTRENQTETAALPEGAYWAMDANELRSLPALPKTAQLYNPELEAAVRERYRRDCEVFGY